jgi:hypothetical protein
VTAAYVERRAEPALDLPLGCQPMAPRSRGNDVRDGIDRADFMEMDGFNWDVMDFGFCMPKKIEGS